MVSSIGSVFSLFFWCDARKEKTKKNSFCVYLSFGFHTYYKVLCNKCHLGFRNVCVVHCFGCFLANCCECGWLHMHQNEEQIENQKTLDTLPEGDEEESL